jgi:hypothetical protein
MLVRQAGKSGVPAGLPCYQISGRQKIMNTLFIIAALVAAVYCFAAVGYYYGFKNWRAV